MAVRTLARRGTVVRPGMVKAEAGAVLGGGTEGHGCGVAAGRLNVSEVCDI